MCVVCGCSHPETAQPPGPAVQANAQGDLHFGANAARVSVPGMSASRTIALEADILGANNRIAQQNRAHFEAHGVCALNLVSSPGSGKTTLLCETITALRLHHPQVHVAVIEGDQETSFDADRIRATGAQAVQVNTGKGCHLDAPMVAQAFAQLHTHAHEHAHEHSHAHVHEHHHAHAQGSDHGHEHGHTHGHDHGHADPEASLLFIENVGNLVCPAVWDLGEAAKVAVLSVTEGEDKPLKYPDMFAAAELMVLNKIDLLAHVRFDVERCIALARQVNPRLQVLQVSATRGDGMSQWLHWLLERGGRARQQARAQREQALQAQIAQLQKELASLRG